MPIYCSTWVRASAPMQECPLQSDLIIKSKCESIGNDSLHIATRSARWTDAWAILLFHVQLTHKQNQTSTQPGVMWLYWFYCTSVCPCPTLMSYTRLQIVIVATNSYPRLLYRNRIADKSNGWYKMVYTNGNHSSYMVINILRNSLFLSLFPIRLQ